MIICYNMHLESMARPEPTFASIYVNQFSFKF